jgi:hypothetical protein
MQKIARKMVCLGIPQILFFGKTLRKKIQNLLKIAEASGLHSLQEWLKMPTAILYADGQKSGPSA